VSDSRPQPDDCTIHESAYVDAGAEIGSGTSIWHFSHVMSGAKIGRNCSLGQNVHIASDVVVGNNVKIQNNVSLFTGTIVEDDVFLGPSCVLTNVTNPRSQISRQNLYERTLLSRGATIGANATIVCGVEIGRYAFVAAGAVVAEDVPDYALMVGVPARRVGWMSRHGHRLTDPDAHGTMTCSESKLRYREEAEGRLRCIDLDEDAPLPRELTSGSARYDELKAEREPKT
jgi:UDP-2-acetamido-3-amino-2,3-dideoxy-glucuronate N-acetyltransferase